MSPLLHEFSHHCHCSVFLIRCSSPFGILPLGFSIILEDMVVVFLIFFGQILIEHRLFIDQYVLCFGYSGEFDVVATAAVDIIFDGGFGFFLNVCYYWLFFEIFSMTPASEGYQWFYGMNCIGNWCRSVNCIEFGVWIV